MADANNKRATSNFSRYLWLVIGLAIAGLLVFQAVNTNERVADTNQNGEEVTEQQDDTAEGSVVTTDGKTTKQQKSGTATSSEDMPDELAQTGPAETALAATVLGAMALSGYYVSRKQFVQISRNS